MTFRNDHIFTTGTQNPCVMDSDIPDIEGSPTENLEGLYHCNCRDLQY